LTYQSARWSRYSQQYSGKISSTDREAFEVLHITADNVDIQLDTLDKKKSFHGTQMVAFVRNGQNADGVLSSINRSRRKSLKLPAALHTISHTNTSLHSAEPQFQR